MTSYFIHKATNQRRKMSEVPDLLSMLFIIVKTGKKHYSGLSLDNNTMLRTFSIKLPTLSRLGKPCTQLRHKKAIPHHFRQKHTPSKKWLQQRNMTMKETKSFNIITQLINVIISHNVSFL